MTDLTRKLCYRKDDRAMRPIYRCPENFAQSLTRDVNFVFFPKIDYCFEKNRFFFDYRIWALLPRYAATYVTLCNVPRAARHEVLV